MTYAPKIDKGEAPIDWSQDALAIERQVRAFNPWPIAQAQLGGEAAADLRGPRRGPDRSGRRVAAKRGQKATEIGTIIGVQDDYMSIQCGRGTLAVTQVQRPGRRAVSVRDFAHSLDLAGQRLG